jgi:hypothetical protein
MTSEGKSFHPERSDPIQPGQPAPGRRRHPAGRRWGKVERARVAAMRSIQLPEIHSPASPQLASSARGPLGAKGAGQRYHGAKRTLSLKCECYPSLAKTRQASNRVPFGAIGAMRVVLESGARRAACSAPWAGSCEPPGCCAFADMNFVMGRRGYGGRYSIWPSWLFSSPTGAALAPAPGAGLGRCPRRRGARSV